MVSKYWWSCPVMRIIKYLGDICRVRNKWLRVNFVRLGLGPQLTVCWFPGVTMQRIDALKANQGIHSPSLLINQVHTPQVILYSGEPLSHHVEMAYLNTCAKSHSILFKFRILFDFENLTLSCRGGFEETKVNQKCTHKFAFIAGENSQYHGHAYWHNRDFWCYTRYIDMVFKRNIDCDFSYQSKSGTTGFYHTPPLQYIQAISVCEWLDTV